MRRWIAALLSAVLVLLCVPGMAELPVVRSAPLVYAKSARNGMVRVYLSSMGSVTALDITVDGSYIADGAQDVSLTSRSQIRVTMNAATGQLTLTANGRTYAMGREMALRRRETSGTNGLRIAQAKKSANLYPGDLHLVAQLSGGTYRLYPIMHIYLENYLCGVVPYEMGNSAQIEALKAQAVAARTYTLNKMNQRASGLYDVVDTTNDQVYYGNSDTTTNCTEAVMATKGIVLMNGSSLTSTWYTASNGGQTESARNCWGSSGYDYLVVKDDPFDLQNAASTVKSTVIYGDWSASGQVSGLRNLLDSKVRTALGSGAVISRVTGVTPHSPKYAEPSRLYTKMDFALQVVAGGTVRAYTVTCDIFSELESALGLSINASKNELWSVQSRGSDFVVQSRRYGHGVGMSQRGAMRMGALGYTYDQILGFYYENSKRMQYTFTHTILSGVTNETIEYEEPPAEITDPDAVYATVTLSGVTDTTALRTGADSGAALITRLPNGTIVTPLEKGASWTKVRYGSLVGYVRTDVLSFKGDVPASSGDSVTPVSRWATVSCNGTLNLRAEAALSAKVVTTIPDGEILVVFSTKNGFARVQYGAHVGYASLDFLRMSDTYPGAQTAEPDAPASGEEAVVSTTADYASIYAQPGESAVVLGMLPRGDSVIVLHRGDLWCTVSLAGQTAYMRTADLRFSDSVTDVVTGYATVTTPSGSLNLRSRPSAGSGILTTIPRGATVPVLASQDGWTKVTYGGHTGWVMSTFLTMNGGATPEPPAVMAGYARVATPSGSLNLRQTPDGYAKVLTTIPQGTRIGILIRQGGWSQTYYAGYTGWVMDKYLAFEGQSATPTPAPVIPSTPSDLPESQPAAGYATVIGGGSLNLRAEPSGQGQVIAQIPEGMRVETLLVTGSWTKVRYNGLTGYVMSKYLAPVTADGEAPSAGVTATVNTPSGGLNLRDRASADGKVLAVIPRGSSITVLERGETWSKAVYAGQMGWVMSQFLRFGGDASTQPDTPSASADAWVTTPSGTLNFRQEPSSGAKVIGQIAPGTKVVRLHDDGTWSRIIHNGVTGYVQSKFLSDTPVQQPSAGAMSGTQSAVRYVNTPSGSLNLRRTPDAAGDVIAAIPRGEAVTLLEEGDAWCFVAYGAKQGWVAGQYLSASRPAAITVAPDPTAAPEKSDAPVYDDTLREADDVPAIVHRDAANVFLYRWCAEDAPVEVVLHGGDEVIVTQTGRTWCRIRFNDTEGYCLGEHLMMMGLEVEMSND